MSIGYVGIVMKNNEKLREFPIGASIEADGTFRVAYDNYDFIGIHGLKRRNWKFLGIKKKKDIKSKIFQHDNSWVIPTDRGAISFWDGVSQAQLRLDSLSDPDAYEKQMTEQLLANDIFYYCKAGIYLLNKLVMPEEKLDLRKLIIPAMLVGGIILASVVNLYALSNIPQMYTTIHQVSGGIYSLGNYFQHLAGIT